MRVAVPVVVGLLFMVWEAGIGLQPGYPSRLDTENQNAAVTTAPQTPQDKAITESNAHLNFKDADILQIINLMSKLTGKNFLLDKTVRGKVTIIAPQTVSINEAYQVFVSILEVHGFTVVPRGQSSKSYGRGACRKRATNRRRKFLVWEICHYSARRSGRLQIANAKPIC